MYDGAAAARMRRRHLHVAASIRHLLAALALFFSERSAGGKASH
jgi:hypothetical protein